MCPRCRRPVEDGRGRWEDEQNWHIVCWARHTDKYGGYLFERIENEKLPKRYWFKKWKEHWGKI